MSNVRESILGSTLNSLKDFLSDKMSVAARVVAVAGLTVATLGVSGIAHAQNNNALGQSQAVQAAAQLLYQNQQGSTWQGANAVTAWGNIAGGLANNPGTAAAARAIGSIGAAVYENSKIGNNGQQGYQQGYGQPQPVYKQPVYNQHVYQQQYPQRTNYQTYNGQTASPLVAQVQQQLNNNQQNFTNAGFQQYGNPEQQRVQILAQTGRLVAEAMNIPGAYEVAYNHPFVQQVQGTKHFQDGFNQTRQELQRTMQSAQPSALPTGYSR